MYGIQNNSFTATSPSSFLLYPLSTHSVGRFMYLLMLLDKEFKLSLPIVILLSLWGLFFPSHTYPPPSPKMHVSNCQIMVCSKFRTFLQSFIMKRSNQPFLLLFFCMNKPNIILYVHYWISGQPNHFFLYCFTLFHDIHSYPLIIIFSPGSYSIRKLQSFYQN